MGILRKVIIIPQVLVAARALYLGKDRLRRYTIVLYWKSGQDGPVYGPVKRRDDICRNILVTLLQKHGKMPITARKTTGNRERN